MCTMFDSRSEPADAGQTECSPLAAPVDPTAPRAVRRALEYMHANLAGPLRLEDIAGAARLSVFHFSRTFRKVVGMGPHRYLVRARVDRVKALLVNGDESLAAIADATGFSDQSHMSKVFRKHTGVSPRRYRMDGDPTRCPLQAWLRSRRNTDPIQ